MLLTCLAAPGLVMVIDAVVSGRWPGPGGLVLRLVAFGTAMVIFVRAASAGGVSPPLRRQSTVTFASALVAAGGAVLLLPIGPQRTAIVLLSAGVEELVFRRELPAALASQFERIGRRGFARAGAVLLSQVAFAVCHFVVRGQPPPFGDGLPFLRLVAAGGFLAVIVRASGLPAAVAVHFALNELRRTGRWGGFVAPPGGTAVLCAGLAVLGVVALERLRRALPAGWAAEDHHRTPDPRAHWCLTVARDLHDAALRHLPRLLPRRPPLA